MNEHDSYNPLNNSINSAEDDLYEEKKQIEQAREDLDKTNLFKIRIIESEINSNLTFQILLYFNIYYYIECAILETLCILYRYSVLNTNSQSQRFLIFKVVLFFAWVISEPIRITFGYNANINESFYHLILFLILSAISILLHILAFFDSKVGIIFPLEYACTIIFYVFLLLEIIFCIIFSCSIIDKQEAFYNIRHSKTYIISSRKKIKTSQEIEEELYIKFPELKKKKKKVNNNYNDYMKKNN